MEKQKSVKLNEDPVLETSALKARLKTLETHLTKLSKRKLARPKKSPTSTSSAPRRTGSEAVSDDDGDAPDGRSTTTIPVEEATQLPHDEL